MQHLYQSVTAQLGAVEWPRRRIGYLSPVALSDVVPYIFYKAFPHGTILVLQDLGLRTYEASSVWTALQQTDEILDAFRAKQVDLLVLGGSVLSFSFDERQLRQRVRAISEQVDAPTVTDLAATVDAMLEQEKGSVVVAHRLAMLDESSVRRYLEARGLEVVGIHGHPSDPMANVRSDYSEAAVLAERLVIEAVTTFPGADAVLLLGGSWIVQPSIPAMELQVGLPIFNNVTGFIWSVAKLLGTEVT
jgi:maleate cis-trans isomerase